MSTTTMTKMVCAALLNLVTVMTTTMASACTTDLDCSLNGKCLSASCMCTKPWSGVTCGKLAYALTPASAKSLYNVSDPRNTWNGPIVTGPDGKYHLYNPIYHAGSLGGPTSVLHGVATNITGPYDWSSPPLKTNGGENPAAVVFKNETTGKMVYSIWIGGSIQVSDSPDGPFTKLDGSRYPGGNPAPVFHEGVFYMTSQKTTEISMTTNLGGSWKQFSTISHAEVPLNWNIEDPFMWVDTNSNWHIINHAYNNYEYEHCGNSTASAHFFSEDGKDWHTSDVQPYSHTVQFDDGTSHTYTTLERPNLHFNANGQLTHLNVAADLITGDEGCGNRTGHVRDGHTPCDNCKWNDHAGTIIISLDV
eukprot:m.262103 g.262103  ORF g.262103 m.262103 type:complete len:363 (-) comp44380_c0_seq1:127-1215(-)